MVPLLNLKLNVRDATGRSRTNKPFYSPDVGVLPPANKLPRAEMDPFSLLDNDMIHNVLGSIDDCRQFARMCLVSKALCADERFWHEALRLRGWTLTWDGAADPRNVFRMLCELDDRQRERLLLLNLEGTTIGENA